MLQGKKILLAITGSIAAYKAALLVRLLVKEGAEVKVLMTPYATKFITPLTLATLSKNKVLVSFAEEKTGEWNNHVELGLWADAFVFAPSSANTLAACANGLAQNLVVATYLSARCPVFFAPAMDLDMYQHSSTQRNLQTLNDYGNYIISSTFGELASGLVGEGRMAEPESIVHYLINYFEVKNQFEGQNILITAGPTYEKIDPVRFIGNHSTGKMGYAIAESFARRGAKVNLVSGPTQISLERPNIQITRVQTAQEMYEASEKVFAKSDIIILAAAVADYAPKIEAKQKIKKQSQTMSLDLVKTIDIAKTLGQVKTEKQVMVGFALETENEKAHALAKLESKNLDLILLNSLNDRGAGFGYDTNKITILGKNSQEKGLPLQSKKEIAEEVVSFIHEEYSKK